MSDEYTCFDRRHELDSEYVAHKAAKSAVKEVFYQLGIDVDNPEKLEEFRKDLRLSNQLRKAMDKGILTVIYTGVIVFFVAGFYSIYGKFHGGG